MRRRTNVRITKLILAISFIILFGRMIYAGIGAVSHHQEKQRLAPDQTSAQPATPR